MTENEIYKRILDAAFNIHTTLGPGLLVVRQQAVPVTYEPVHLEEGFRTDCIVEGEIIIELKTGEVIAPVQKKPLLTHLRLMNLKLGRLINFGETLIKEGICRVVNRL